MLTESATSPLRHFAGTLSQNSFVIPSRSMPTGCHLVGSPAKWRRSGRRSDQVLCQFSIEKEIEYLYIYLLVFS